MRSPRPARANDEAAGLRWYRWILILVVTRPSVLNLCQSKPNHPIIPELTSDHVARIHAGSDPLVFSLDLRKGVSNPGSSPIRETQPDWHRLVADASRFS